MCPISPALCLGKYPPHRKQECEENWPWNIREARERQLVETVVSTLIHKRFVPRFAIFSVL